MKTQQYGLVFDMDGVIADTEGLNALAAIRVFEECFHVKGVEKADFEAGIGRGAEAYMRAAAEAKGLTWSDQDVQRAVDARQVCILNMLEKDPLPAFPGVLELMEAAMSSPDWSVAIATGSTKEKTEAVLCSALVPYAHIVLITGSEPHARKPAPDMFLAAARQLGLEPCQCVVIEDSVSGIRAAKDAGMLCLAVTNTFEAARLSAADIVVDSLAGVTLARLAKRLACGMSSFWHADGR